MLLTLPGCASTVLEPTARDTHATPEIRSTPPAITTRSAASPHDTQQIGSVGEGYRPAVALASTYRAERKRRVSSYDNVWVRIRAGFSLPPLENKYVTYYERWYSQHPAYWSLLITRASRYLYHIVEEVEKRGLPMELALLPAVESSFDPLAHSRASAEGLWQFIPSTGRRFGLRQTWWYDGRRDIIQSTDAALDYLTFLNLEFHNDWFHALAGYNAGETAVFNAMEYNRRRNRATNYANLPLRTQTVRYVPKLIAIRNIISEPSRFGVTLPTISNYSYFDRVSTHSQIDLELVAQLADVPLKELRQLNPGYKRWATDPDGPHRVLIPSNRAQELRDALTRVPPEARMRWIHYQIKPGETLIGIARRHGVTVSAIRKANSIKGSLIRAGGDLLIPVSGKTYAYTNASEEPSVARIDAAASEPIVHQVRAGDTLWAIARTYKVYISQLIRWNAIRTDDTLRPGQKILVHSN
ncbi:MAG: LysM peptidoglycan-binding domain-containing protein [Gammaproteobacteria bacterium]|nr:LysM peptidoglycan-binding domain-containing protein [Gammaproteobacteria bacterium]